MTMTIILWNYSCVKEILDTVYSGTNTDFVNGSSQNNAGLAVVGWKGLVWLGGEITSNKQRWTPTLLFNAVRGNDGNLLNREGH